MAIMRQARVHHTQKVPSHSLHKIPARNSQPTSLNSHIQFHRNLGNQHIQSLYQSLGVQAKLTIGQPNDKYEQEADRVADQVMRMPVEEVRGISKSAAALQRTCAACASGSTLCPSCGKEEQRINRKTLVSPHTPLIQRQTEEFEEEKEKEELIQAKRADGQSPEITPTIQAHLSGIRGTGQPLSPAERGFFEPRFGYDFGVVRVHTDTQAAQTARALKARAFTIGRDIVFGAGHQAQGTDGGKRLLAHELTHVVQQVGGGGSSIAPMLLQRQQQVGPPPPRPRGAAPPGPDFECSLNFSAGRWQEFLGCCARMPVVGRFCSDHVRQAWEFLNREEGGPASPPVSPVHCPSDKGPTPFGTCCPRGQVWMGNRCGAAPPVEICYPLDRLSPFGTCCPPTEAWNILENRCEPRKDPEEAEPVVPTPTVTAPRPVEVFFKFERPRSGETGDSALQDSLTADGRINFGNLVAQLQAELNLRVQLIGRASPEGAAGFNLQLGTRRAQIVADALEGAGIDHSRIADVPGGGLAGECQRLGPGLATCGEAGATGEHHRQVEARFSVAGTSRSPTP